MIRPFLFLASIVAGMPTAPGTEAELLVQHREFSRLPWGPERDPFTPIARLRNDMAPPYRSPASQSKRRKRARQSPALRRAWGLR